MLTIKREEITVLMKEQIINFLKIKAKEDRMIQTPATTPDGAEIITDSNQLATQKNATATIYDVLSTDIFYK